MELKQRVGDRGTDNYHRLNRTFYGIETDTEAEQDPGEQGLNRTFYGIETKYEDRWFNSIRVLIVPFMELKLTQRQSKIRASRS